MSIRKKLLFTTAVALVSANLAAGASAADFTVSGPSVTTNDGNTLDGNDSLTITATGSINTLASDAVDATGYYNSIVNSGYISTTGPSNIGIDITNKSEILNEGTIITSGDNGKGIDFYRDNVVTNAGLITSFGDSADGISGWDNNTVTNTGTINVHGDDGKGIDVDDYNVIVNTGSITTYGQGFSSHGIIGLRDSIISNSGSITTFGNYAMAVRGSDRNTISNSGSINTSGYKAYGIDVRQDNSVTNSGSISTLGDSAYGILTDDDNTITHTGSIVTSGVNAHGVYFFGDDNYLLSSGSIYASGAGAHGISDHESNNEVTVSGSVVSVQSFALYLGPDATLNLADPAFLGGEIRLGNDSNDAVVNIETGTSHSVLWQFDPADLVGGAPNVTGDVPFFYNPVTGLFATFDPSSFSGGLNELGDLAALFSDAGPDDCGTGVWASAFGGDLDHAATANSLAGSVRQTGLAAGYCWQHTPNLRVEVKAGRFESTSSAQSSVAKTFTRKSEGWFAGLKGSTDRGGVKVDFGLNIARASHDQDRFVNDNLAPLGVGSALGSSDSLTFIPEIQVSRTMSDGAGWQVTPRASLRYAMQKVEGFQEAGNSAFEVGKQELKVLEGEVAVSAERALAVGSFTTEFGIMGRRGDTSGSVGLFGDTIAINTDLDTQNSYFAGAGLSMPLFGGSLDIKAKAYTGDQEGYTTSAVLNLPL